MRHTLMISLILSMVAMMPWAYAQDTDDAAVVDEVVTTESADEEVTTAQSPDGGIIVICPISGDIEPGLVVVVERAIKEAKKLKAKAIIFKVDTFGGRVDSAIDITTLIGKAPCRTIAFIEGRGAISAGAIISFSCDDIIMAPDSNIGASMVVYHTGEGMQAAEEKSVSLVRAKMRSLAIANGHNPDIAEAMVDTDIELRGYTDEMGDYIVFAVGEDGSKKPAIQSAEYKEMQEVIDTITEDMPIDVTITPKDDDADEGNEKVVEEVLDAIAKNANTAGNSALDNAGTELVLAKGKLLTLTPSEAKKYGLIDGTATTINETVTHYLLGGNEYHIIEANWAEKMYRFLTSPAIAGILMMLGIGGVYVEIRTPGFGLPGIIGVTCLVLFFGSHYILGVADTIDILLVLVGFGLILLEVFVIPGFGLAGVAGILCLMAGVYLSLVNFTFPQYTWEYESLNRVAYTFSVFVLSFIGFMYLTWKLMPLLPFYSAMVLADTQDAQAGYVGQDLDFAAASIGLRGNATTMLRPAGKGRFNERTYDIVTRGDFIESGTPIVIVEAEGNRYVVEALDEEV